MKTTEHDPRRSIRNLNIVGLSAVAVFLGGVGGWATTVPLTGAVIGAGTLVVESSIKKVQHPTGGVVGQIAVREGSLVKQGDVVIRLDDTVPRSTLGVVRAQLDEAMAREARLLAERDGTESVMFPAELTNRGKDAVAAAALAGEEKLFQSRRNGRTGQRLQLRERVAQTNEEIAGLAAQLNGKEGETKLVAEELVGVTQLYKQKLITIQRLMALQRDQARLDGERGQLIGSVARARAKISETELQILQLEQDFRTEVLKDLRDTQGKIAELREKTTAAEDQLKRIEIRAPQTGIVHQLAVHTVGGVVANGEAIMLIVPVADKLMVEARIPPQDIDQFSLGATTTVRILAGNQRTMSDIFGEVTHIGADLTKDKDQPNQAYYVVRASIPEEQIRRLDALKLVPGMPAEIFIQTDERTLLQYLLRPLHEQIFRAFRER
jgi:HlyD family secretion protein